MSGNSKGGWGKGHRSASRISRRHKNKFWKEHLDGKADDGGDEEHMPVVMWSDIEEEISTWRIL